MANQVLALESREPIGSVNLAMIGALNLYGK